MDERINNLINRGALFVVNHSGGKDSQAMLLHVRSIVPVEQILVIHAHLPGVEWEGTEKHVKATAEMLPNPVIVCQSVKTFFQMVERRGMFPSPQQRQCTSDLKRGPIEREIRRFLKARPEFNGLIVNCMGLRAEESTSRAKATTFKQNERNSKAGREWYDWLPIHDWLVDAVFTSIEAAGQKPHWAYAAGMSRLSCCFCIMSSQSDLRTAARLRPDLLNQYDQLERQIGQVMMMPKNGIKRTLKQIVSEAA